MTTHMIDGDAQTTGGNAQTSKSKADSFYGLFPEFNVAGKTIIVTGGGRGLSLAMAERLFLGGSIVHVLDIMAQPEQELLEVQRRSPGDLGGELHYHSLDIRNTDLLQQTIKDIAATRKGLHGLIAGAGILSTSPALETGLDEIRRVFDINYTGVFMTAQACAREMVAWKTPGSILLVASMSGLMANKGMNSPVYNSSKAAVDQLSRNMASEWGSSGIRVNAMCPGHVITPMVLENFEKNPESRGVWERENMLGRLANANEFTGSALFFMSEASSFVTASSFVIDGGHTSW